MVWRSKKTLQKHTSKPLFVAGSPLDITDITMPAPGETFFHILSVARQIRETPHLPGADRFNIEMGNDARLGETKKTRAATVCVTTS